MRKLISVLVLFVLSITCAAAEGTAPAVTIIGGADGPTAIFVGTDGPTAELTDGSVPLLLNECAAQLHALSGDQVLLDALTDSEEIRRIAAAFHEDSRNGIVSWRRINDAELLSALAGEMDGLSDAARAYLDQRVFSASFLSAMISSKHGANALAAASLLNVCRPLTADLSTAMYLARCENDTGMAMGVWNNGDGIVLVTASFVPDIGSLEENTGLADLLP